MCSPTAFAFGRGSVPHIKKISETISGLQTGLVDQDGVDRQGGVKDDPFLRFERE